MALLKLTAALSLWLTLCATRPNDVQGKITGMTRSSIANSQNSILAECRDPPIKKWWSCGEGQCECRHRMAYCSDDFGRARRYIPKLPPTTRTLCFGRNYLASVSPADFFNNVTGISALDLSENDLVDVDPSAFQLVKNLKILSIAGNDKLSASGLSVVFSIGTLKQLDVSYCRLVRLSTDTVHNMTALAKLHTLFLRGNDFETMNLTSFSSLTSLTILDMDHNRLSEVHIHSVLSVEELSLNSNNLFDFLQTCNQKNVSLFPNLKRLSLRDNHLYSLPTNLCLPNLQMLDLGGNEWQFLLANYFNGIRFPRLVHLDLSKTYTVVLLLNSTFVNLTSLNSVNLAESGLSFFTMAEVWNSFENCANVASLDLYGNSFTDFFPSVSFRKEGLNSLKQLNLGSCHISSIQALNICHFQQLVELNLSWNSVSHIRDGAFDCLRNLTSLNLSWNQITIVSPDTFNIVTRHRLQNLDLRRNEFHCSCDLLWFQTWLKSSPSLFCYSSAYMCYNIPKVRIVQVALTEQPCMFDHSTYVAMVYVCSLLLLSLVVVLALSRYRWHLRLLLYEVCRGRGEARRMRLRNGNFDYDVFVSYDTDDQFWVRQHLVPELEVCMGLRLCLHQRDFIPGRPIVDNIVTCVEASKKVLMVFSVSFARSRWCQFELTYCLQHVMDYDDDLIIVCLDDVTSREMTVAMMGVLRTTTYIAWKPNNADAIASFWGRVRISLQDIL